MSKYFQVLERLERGRAGAGVAPTVSVERAVIRPTPRQARSAARPVVEPVAKPDPAEPARAQTPAPVADLRARRLPAVEPFEFRAAAGPLSGIDAIFQNIEVLTRGKRPMTLVFAGASATDWVDALAKSFAEHAEAKGDRVLVAELSDSGGERTLLCRRPAVESAGDKDGERAGVPVDLRGGATRETLAEWREQVGPETDITILVGPPLVTSVDSALLASLCDGLVLVAVHQETHRQALAIASERARVSRCPSVAVVVNRDRDKIPAWLRRILDR